MSHSCREGTQLVDIGWTARVKANVRNTPQIYHKEQKSKGRSEYNKEGKTIVFCHFPRNYRL